MGGSGTTDVSFNTRRLPVALNKKKRWQARLGAVAQPRRSYCPRWAVVEIRDRDPSSVVGEREREREKVVSFAR